MIRRLPILSLLLAVAVLAACGGAGSAGGQAESSEAPPAAATVAPTIAPTAVAPAAVPEPTAVVAEVASAESETGSESGVVFADDFSKSVAPIFAGNCASCHNIGGPGATHWQLATAADVVSSHQQISTVVGTGYMPPWPAGDLSLVFHDDRRLSDDEVEAIRQWSAAGAPLDVEASTPIVAPDGVIAFDADVELAPSEPFQGSGDVADDYRCMIYDLGLSETRWLRGFEFVPDQTQLVHHAIGYLAPASAMDRALELSAEDDLGGWQCYGGSGLGDGDDLFLGWAPGQLPTEFPDGSGLRAQSGDFIVLQIHYHFDTAHFDTAHFDTAEAPEDASTIRLAWADDDDLDPIEFDEFIGPAEIPCASTETGPLCDRDAALARAYERYGIQGVPADGINRLCGVEPEDFAAMTDGIASSACTIPVRNFGEIVSVFGHEHELGSSIRLTLNAGRADEQILLDIPNWSFDWQYNYHPVDSVILEPGDTILLECTWDRSKRASDLEPAYVLWADGTNDEMCFAAISTRGFGTRPAPDRETTAVPGIAALDLVVPDELATCLADAGFTLAVPATRDQVDGLVAALFECAEPAEVGEMLSGLISGNFGGLVDDDGVNCLAEGLATPQGARDLLMFALDDATDNDRRPVGELVGDCVSLSDALAAFGFSLPEAARACVDDAGRQLLIQATVDEELPEEQALFRAINPCLSGD